MQNIVYLLKTFANYLTSGLLLFALFCLSVAVWRLFMKKKNVGRLFIWGIMIIFIALLIKGAISLSGNIVYNPTGTGECSYACQQSGYGSGQCESNTGVREVFKVRLDNEVCTDSQYRQDKAKNVCYCSKATTCREICQNIGHARSYCEESRIINGELALLGCNKNIGDIEEYPQFTSDCFVIDPKDNQRFSTCCCGDL